MIAELNTFFGSKGSLVLKILISRVKIKCKKKRFSVTNKNIKSKVLYNVV